jgi:alkylation response protein AidB-like acyl-CoA dehydrogenase
VEGAPAEWSQPKSTMGDLVPFGDPLELQRGWSSPYTTPSHTAWRAYCREFVDREIMPTVDSWKDDAKPPADILLKLGASGLLATMCGPWDGLARLLPAEVVAKLPKDFSYAHEAITFDEISRCGHPSVIAALTNGPAIALSAIVRFGSEEQQRKTVPDVLLGRKFIALAISEPGAGSDVMHVNLEARRSGDEDTGTYTVNGSKKWITNGLYADFFVCLARTGDANNLSLLLVERGMPGFSTRKIDIRGASISGTALLRFDNTPVPAANRIGGEGAGFILGACAHPIPSPPGP